MTTTKRQQIMYHLACGKDPYDIAVLVRCTLSYVHAVMAGRPRSQPERVEHVKMQIGPWSRDSHGNLTRELRGT